MLMRAACCMPKSVRPVAPAVLRPAGGVWSCKTVGLQSRGLVRAEEHIESLGSALCTIVTKLSDKQ
jgi:hypothetical protein